MPLYDYKCGECGHIFEVMQKITEEPLKFCPECKGPIKRLISASGIIFKGTGFHVTDYRSGKDKVASSKGQVASSKEEGKPKATETKSSAKDPAPKKSE
jgi:putative FmdB family regulatory protein